MSDSLELMEREVVRWSGVRYNIETSKTHPKMRLEYNGKSRFLPFSYTKVDRRGMLNKVTELRRVLREMGAVRDHE